MRTAEAREKILRAVARLAGEGLIERTWGNVSARVSETRFLITPSGLAYETLQADQLVMVDIADCSYAGSIKPSSEKGIHADVYRLRPKVNFIIHTHQTRASIAGIEGRALTGFIHPLLGKRIPCAGYGLPGTKQLRRAVAAEVEAWPDCQAFLMRHHGALCLGQDMEDAFAAARALEEVCEARIHSEMGEPGTVPIPRRLGSSQRSGDVFLMAQHGESRRYPVEGTALPLAAALHGAAYQAGNFQYIAHETSPEVLAVSAEGRRLRPYLDDLAQIAGADILCVPPDPKRVRAALRGRNAVLIQGMGALCAGKSESDAAAVRALLRKGCAAKLYVGRVPKCRPLGAMDAQLQRLIYRYSYERKKDPC